MGLIQKYSIPAATIERLVRCEIVLRMLVHDTIESPSNWNGDNHHAGFITPDRWTAKLGSFRNPLMAFINDGVFVGGVWKKM